MSRATKAQFQARDHRMMSLGAAWASGGKPPSTKRRRVRPRKQRRRH